MRCRKWHNVSYWALFNNNKKIMCLNVCFLYYWDFFGGSHASHSPISLLIEKSFTKFGGMLCFHVFKHKLQSKKSQSFNATSNNLVMWLNSLRSLRQTATVYLLAICLLLDDNHVSKYQKTWNQTKSHISNISILYLPPMQWNDI